MNAATKKSTLKKLVYLFTPYKKQLSIIIALLILYTGVFLSIPLINKRIIDDGLLVKNIHAVVFYTSILFGLMLTICVSNVIKDLVRSKIEANIYRDLIEKAFTRLLHIKISFFHLKNDVEIINDIMLDVKLMLQTCDSSVFFAITQLLSFIGGLIGLFIIDYRLALIVLLFIPTKYFLVRYFGNKREKLTEMLMSSTNKFSHWFGDNINGIKDIRLFGIEDVKRTEQRKKTMELAASERAISILDTVNSSTDMILMHFLECLLYVIGSYLVFSDSLSIGSLFAFITYAMQVIDPIANVLNLKYILTGILPSAERFFHFLDLQAIGNETSGNASIDTVRSVQFKNVSFSYGDENIIHNLSFNIDKGQKVAIIGKNGTGKSTIFSMIQRFVQPTSGHIFINNLNIEDIDLKFYRGQLCCVNQVNHLFDMSIIDNITLYNDVEHTPLERAIVASGVDQFASTDELSSKRVGRDGCMLSGGQKQKIILARMLAKNASLYLLDEATSHFDSKSESDVFDMLDEKLKDKIAFFIIHNQELLHFMDKIILLRGPGEQPHIYESYAAYTSAEVDGFSPFHSQT